MNTDSLISIHKYLVRFSNVVLWATVLQSAFEESLENTEVSNNTFIQQNIIKQIFNISHMINAREIQIEVSFVK